MVQRRGKWLRDCKDSLRNKTTLWHWDPKMRLCAYTDASDNVWSEEIPKYQHGKKTKETQKETWTVGLLSGKFSAMQMGWSTVEKQGFTVLATLERMLCLVATLEGLHLFTDHRNNIFILTLFQLYQTFFKLQLEKVCDGPSVKVSTITSAIKSKYRRLYGPIYLASGLSLEWLI